MARRSKKIQPAPLTLNLITPSVAGGATDSFYLDLSQVASLVNRRFYRQGINWAVSGMKIICSHFRRGFNSKITQYLGDV